MCTFQRKLKCFVSDSSSLSFFSDGGENVAMVSITGIISSKKN